MVSSCEVKCFTMLKPLHIHVCKHCIKQTSKFWEIPKVLNRIWTTVEPKVSQVLYQLSNQVGIGWLFLLSIHRLTPLYGSSHSVGLSFEEPAHRKKTDKKALFSYGHPFGQVICHLELLYSSDNLKSIWYGYTFRTTFRVFGIVILYGALRMAMLFGQLLEYLVLLYSSDNFLSIWYCHALRTT